MEGEALPEVGPQYHEPDDDQGQELLLFVRHRHLRWGIRLVGPAHSSRFLAPAGRPILAPQLAPGRQERLPGCRTPNISNAAQEVLL
jgi:hypothetical protein